MPKSKPAATTPAARDQPLPEKEAEVLSSPLYGWVWFGVAVYMVGVILKIAYKIRMGAIDEFGPVIHEFDPYFNYRATEVSKERRVICH